MHFDKALLTPRYLQGEQACSDSFAELTAQIAALPEDLRGAQSLSFAAKLVELAAYELAGSMSSAQIGALIRCAADLSETSTDVAMDRLSTLDVSGRSIQ